jgi:hypothetical protein
MQKQNSWLHNKGYQKLALTCMYTSYHKLLTQFPSLLLGSI